MSDLEDLDHEPEDLHLEEELSVPADHAQPEFPEPSKAGRNPLLKIAAVLAVLVAGGAYFMMSHSAPVKSVAPVVPAADQSAATPLPPLSPAAPKNTKDSDTAAWSGSSAPPPAPAGMPASPAPSQAAAVPTATMPLPSMPQDQVSAPVTGSTGTPAIVNELPPPATQLTNASGAAPPVPANALPSAPPSPFDVATGQAPAPSTPSMPPAGEKSISPEAPGVPPQTAAAPVKEPVSAPGNIPLIKGGEPMPSAAVPSVDKTEIAKTQTENAGQSDQAAALEKKIAVLEKTISELQQAAITKENAVEKPVAEAGTEKTTFTSHHHRAKKTSPPHRHLQHHTVVANTWALKAAKPGVAWVAKRGSDDLQMVTTGDSLPGIGQVTSIVKDESGYWTVNGTRGRISQ